MMRKEWLEVFIHFHDIYAAFCCRVALQLHISDSQVSPKPPHSALEQRIIEDQQIKLSVFCTRPAVVEHYWFFCLFTEVFLTFCLTYGAIAIGDRGTIGIGAQPANAPALLLYSNGFEPFLKAILLLG